MTHEGVIANLKEIAEDKRNSLWPDLVSNQIELEIEALNIAIQVVERHAFEVVKCNGSIHYPGSPWEDFSP